MKPFLLILFVMINSGIGAQPMNNAKDDAESILNVALPFAEELLVKYGEYYPFAYVMKMDGKIEGVAAYNEKEKPNSQDMINQLKKIIMTLAKENKIVASIIIYDGKITLPESQIKKDAIFASIDHKNDYSIVIIIPYAVENRKIMLDNALAQKGSSEIFVK